MSVNSNTPSHWEQAVMPWTIHCIKFWHPKLLFSLSIHCDSGKDVENYLQRRRGRPLKHSISSCARLSRVFFVLFFGGLDKIWRVLIAIPPVPRPLSRLLLNKILSVFFQRCIYHSRVSFFAFRNRDLRFSDGGIVIRFSHFLMKGIFITQSFLYGDLSLSRFSQFAGFCSCAAANDVNLHCAMARFLLLLEKNASKDI